MRLLLSLLTLFAFAFFLPSCQQQSSEPEDPMGALPAADADNGLLQLPAEFGAKVVADSLGRIRHITVRDNGDLYVKMRKRENDEGPGVLALRDTDGDGRMDERAGFANYRGTGIEVHDGYLYVSADTAVFRYPFTPDQLLPDTNGTQIVGGLPYQQQHAAKGMTFDPEGNLYVTVGAPANACQEEMRTPGSPGMDPCPLLERHGGIWQFKADQPGQMQVTDGKRYATGIRHAIGIEWHPEANRLYGMQHGRDQLHQLWPERYTTKQSAELPSEEFLQIDEGDDFGWPYCYFDHLQDKKMLGPEYGGKGEQQGRCEGIEKPIMAFPGHMAPNDMMIYTGDQFPARYKNGALIAFHGSWNRAPLPQKGYFVVFVPLENGLPSGDWEIFAEGFAQEDTINSPGDARYRPVGLAQGPDGSLYVSDSQLGRVWRIMYYGRKEA